MRPFGVQYVLVLYPRLRVQLYRYHRLRTRSRSSTAYGCPVYCILVQSAVPVSVPVVLWEYGLLRTSHFASGCCCLFGAVNKVALAPPVAPGGATHRLLGAPCWLEASRLNAVGCSRARQRKHAESCLTHQFPPLNRAITLCLTHTM